MTELVKINQLRNYAACPNFAKYDWYVPVTTEKNVVRTVLESCYRDVAVLNKRVDWKTVRNRIHNHLIELESNLPTEGFYNGAVAIMESLRNWYLSSYRDGTEEAICNLELEDTISDVNIKLSIDTLLIGKKHITLMEYTEMETAEEVLRDIGLRTKILLLGKQNIKVNKVLAIKCSARAVKTWTLNIDNSSNWNYKTMQVLQLMLLSIKKKLFYPSPTSMCSTCKYRDICSW